MTINIANNDPRINYTATAGQTVFTVPFEFFDNTDIKVYIEGTLKTITTHYTVSGGNGSTGSVTLTAGATLNDEVTLVRDVPMERTTDLTSSYNGSSIDAQLDRIVAQIADLDDKASRTIQINDYELASGLLLPALDSRKGKTIQFNTSTGALEVGPTGADLTAIGSVTSEIATLAGISSNISTVAGSNAQVVAVGNAMTSITAINSALTNINTVAGSISNINTVGGSISDVNDVADSLGEISAVQAKLTNIDTVAIASTNIGTVAGSISQVNSVASKIADVTGVNSNISAITTANANSTNINLVANNVDDVNDVGNVITKVTTVADNITNVNLVAPNAQYLSDVANNITAINAIAPLASDLTNVTDNLTAIQNAGTNATNAANSATSAATDATAAQTAKTAAETALDEFTDIYLGSKSVAPTVDNDGNALATGSIYWNSGVDQLYIWDGSAWDDAAFTASGAVTSFNTRTGAVTLSSADITNAAGLLTTGGTMTGNLSFGDNDKAIFGAGSDLQIYHDGTHSYIDEAGTGALVPRANYGFFFKKYDTNEQLLNLRTDGAVELFYAGSEKLATTSTGIDVTGTVTADGLTVDGDAAVAGTIGVTVDSGTIQTGKDSALSRSHLVMNNPNGVVAKWDTNGTDLLHYVTDEYKLYTAGNKAFEVDGNGDISFYEDTGTTAKFFWDSSAESLGIGTSSPESTVHLKGTGNVTTALQVESAATGYAPKILFDGIIGANADYLLGEVSASWDTATNKVSAIRFESGSDTVNKDDGLISFWTSPSASTVAERMRIDSSGNVGIGTANPASPTGFGSSGILHLKAGTGNDCSIVLEGLSGSGGRQEIGASGGALQFYRGAATGSMTESMRIDSSGRVGIGTSSPNAPLTVIGGTNTAPSIQLKGGVYANDNASIHSLYSLKLKADSSESIAGRTISFEVGTTSAMRIDSSGNVGIGTSPSERFEVNVPSGNGLLINSADIATIKMKATGGSVSNWGFATTNLAASDFGIYRSNSAGGDPITAGTPKMYFNASGQVGIGDSSPSARLEIGGMSAGEQALLIQSGRNDALSNGLARINITDVNCPFAGLQINHAGTGPALVAIGAVAIGDANPTRHGQTTKTLVYNGSSTTTDFALHVGRVGTGAENQICITNGYGKVGSVTTSGTSTSYNTSSDYRLKENLVDLTGASARVNQLNPLRFNWITDETNTLVDGFLAHEVATIVPEAITGTKDAMMDEEYEVTPATGDIYIPATEAYVDGDGNEVDAVDEVIHSADAQEPETLEDGQQWRETTAAVMGTRSVPDYQGIDQSKLVPLLTAALQEALTEIASLKTRVEALEG